MDAFGLLLVFVQLILFAIQIIWDLPLLCIPILLILFMYIDINE